MHVESTHRRAGITHARPRRCGSRRQRRLIVVDASGAAQSIAACVLLSRTRRALHEWYTIRAPVRAAPPEFFPAAFHSPAHRHQRASIESTCCLSARAQPRPTRDAMASEREARVPGATGAMQVQRVRRMCVRSCPVERQAQQARREIDNCGVNASRRLRHGSRSPPAQEPSDRQRRDDRDGENRNGDRPLPAARLWFGRVCRVELLRRLRRPRAIQRTRR